VSLILNIETGLVSPQYHCTYDDLFKTATRTQARSIPKSKWQHKAGFTSVEESEEEEEEEEGYKDPTLDEAVDEENSVHEEDVESDQEPTEQEITEQAKKHHKVRESEQTTRKIESSQL